MITIGNASDFAEHKNYPITIENHRLLLISCETVFFLIHDHCGHFGVTLEKGTVEQAHIRCPVHGIVFKLSDGSVINRPWENAQPLMIIPLTEKEGVLMIESI